jgi:uncharacterized membrane protein
MESRAKLFGHSLHQMLVGFPLGLLSIAALFDILYFFTRSTAFSTTAYHLIVVGIIGGLAASPFGFVDWLAIPVNTRARRIGRLHGLGNAAVIVLFAISWWLRRANASAPSLTAIGLSLAGAGLVLASGWLGGELLDRLGVGVDDGAHLDAPSSLSRRQARSG